MRIKLVRRRSRCTSSVSHTFFLCSHKIVLTLFCKMKISIVPFLFGLFPAMVKSMLASPHSFNETQPSGEIVELQIHGTPADRYVSDSQG